MVWSGSSATTCPWNYENLAVPLSDLECAFISEIKPRLKTVVWEILRARGCATLLVETISISNKHDVVKKSVAGPECGGCRVKHQVWRFNDQQLL